MPSSTLFQNYDPASKSTDVAGEVAAAAGSPVEVSNFYPQIALPLGLAIARPTSTLDIFMPYIEAELATTYAPGSAYDYLPDKLSFDLYGTYDLWEVLMALNGVSRREDFVGPSFTIVRASAGKQLLQAMALATSMTLQEAAADTEVSDLTLVPVPYLGQ